jgi:hypothetical protein
MRQLANAVSRFRFRVSRFEPGVFNGKPETGNGKWRTLLGGIQKLYEINGVASNL